MYAILKNYFRPDHKVEPYVHFDAASAFPLSCVYGHHHVFQCCCQ